MVPTKKDKERILSDFSMETELNPNTLRVYIQRHSELAVELTDLFHELTFADLATSTESILGEEELTQEGINERIAIVRSAFSGQNLRDLAQRMELPRDFFVGFRDARVRIGSVPASVLVSLAKAIDVKIQYFIGYLQKQSGTSSAVSFKANAKPQMPMMIEYGEFIQSLSLDEKETTALKRLTESNECQ